MVVVSQLLVLVGLTTKPPSGSPSTKNCTPLVEEVFAAKVTVPERGMPPDGEVRVMAGGEEG